MKQNGIPSTNGHAPDEYLTLVELQTIMKLSRATVWRWRQEQGLPVVEINGITRIRKRDLDEFLSRHRTQRSSKGAAKKLPDKECRQQHNERSEAQQNSPTEE